jgi:catechol 2,3-dioxygenase-like lactoylglutathione lyase family enzyme
MASAAVPADMVLGMTFDCADATAQARFWASALGYVPASPPRGWDTWESWLIDLEVPREEWDDGASLVDPAGIGPGISFLKVPEPKTAKNRLHLDLKVSGGRDVDQELRRTRILAKVDEVVAAGATIVEEHVVRERLDHVVLHDPEGNEFCVA